MDAFGFGAALRGVAKVYFISARRSGRTTALVESLKDGDKVICRSHMEGNSIKDLCKRRGVEIEICAVNPAEWANIYQVPPAKRRMVFDHTWVEEFYLQQIEDMGKFFERVQQERSGSGEQFETAVKISDIRYPELQETQGMSLLGRTIQWASKFWWH